MIVIYNLNGILYDALSAPFITIFCGIFLLFISLTDNKKTAKNEKDSKKASKKEREEKKERITNRVVGIFAIVFSLYYFGSRMYIYINPQITYHEGYYIDEYRYHGYPPLTFYYIFTDTKDSNAFFYLDVFTRKEIFNEDFSTDTKYRIYYENTTDTIVKVEVVESDEEMADSS